MAQKLSEDEIRVQTGYVMTLANEFLEFIIRQTQSGASPVVIAAGIAACLEECAKIDLGMEDIRIRLATLLKDAAR